MGVIVKYFESPEGVLDGKIYDYLYRCTEGYKSIIFVNSRTEVEKIAMELRARGVKRGKEEFYLVHHGDISTNLREDAEEKMKNNLGQHTVIATVTLELGIDIGELGRVVQVGTPYTVSGFSQRVGRCGRRGQRAEIVYAKEASFDNPVFPDMDWELLRGIAVLQLYLTQKWTEPIQMKQKPFSVLYHQTMMHLKVKGMQKPSVLAQEIMTMSSFKNITQEEYRVLLRHLIEIKHIEKMENGYLRLTDKGASCIIQI